MGNLPRCGDKHKHLSEGKAESQLRSLVDRYNVDPDSMSVYFCPICSYWHVGHIKKKSLERIKRRKNKGY